MRVDPNRDFKSFKKSMRPFCGDTCRVMMTATTPEELESQDITGIIEQRSAKAIGIYSRRKNQAILIQRLRSWSNKKGTLEFVRPNSIALCLNIYHTHLEKAKEYYNRDIMSLLAGKRADSPNELSALYDYFEQMQICIVFAYSSLECFANMSIPDDYVYEQTNNKGVKETWHKDQLERYQKLSLKLDKILPKALSVDSPKKEIKIEWQHFCKLEEIRHDLVHQKSVNDVKVFEEFLSPEIFDTLNSANAILEFFVKQDQNNSIFPYNISTRKTAIVEVDDFEDVILE